MVVQFLFLFLLRAIFQETSTETDAKKKTIHVSMVFTLIDHMFNENFAVKPLACN